MILFTLTLLAYVALGLLVAYIDNKTKYPYEHPLVIILIWPFYLFIMGVALIINGLIAFDDFVATIFSKFRK